MWSSCVATELFKLDDMVAEMAKVKLSREQWQLLHGHEARHEADRDKAAQMFLQMNCLLNFLQNHCNKHAVHVNAKLHGV